MLFNINYQLCKTYPAFNPFQIDAYKYHDVIMLYAETKRVTMEEQKEINKAQGNGKTIRKPANDSWF